MTYDEWLFKVFEGEAFPTLAQDRLARMAWDAATNAERHDCEIAVWLVRLEATKPDAPDEGVDGWLQEAEDRIRMRSNA